MGAIQEAVRAEAEEEGEVVEARCLEMVVRARLRLTLTSIVEGRGGSWEEEEGRGKDQCQQSKEIHL